MTHKRKPNPWLEDAQKFGAQMDSFVAINPRDNPKSWQTWRDYFAWLNWIPFWFAKVELAHRESKTSDLTWTAPIADANDFKPRFKPASARVRSIGGRRPELPQGALANLFVGRDKPRYAEMVERAKTAPPEQWMWFTGHRLWGDGIKVPLSWYRDGTGPDETKKPWFQSLSATSAQEFLDANEWKP